MARSKCSSVDEYIVTQPQAAQAALKRVRATIRAALPQSVEGISYQIPMYKLDGRMVLYFAGFKEHYSIYPMTTGILRALKKELAGRLHGKATIRFSYDDAVPLKLITRIAKLRAAEVAELRSSGARSISAVREKAAAKKQRRVHGAKAVR